MGGRTGGGAWRRDPVLWSLAALCAVIVLIYGAGLGSDGFRDALFWPPQPLLDLTFAICCHRVCTHPNATGAERGFWRAMRTAGLVFVVGDVYSASAALAGLPAGWFPAVDVHTMVIAAGVLRAAWAMLAHPVRWRGSERLRMWLDLNAAVAGAAIFVWYFWLGGAEPASAEFALAAVTGTLMLVVSFGSGKLALGGEAPFGIASGISGGLTTLVLAMAASVPGSVIQTWNADLVHLAWLAPGFTLALTPRLHELELRRRSGPERPELEEQRRPRARQGWLPYLALAACQGLLIVAAAREGDVDRQVAGVLAGVTVIIALIMFRQVLAIRDNEALVTRLDASLRELAGFQDRLWHEARHDQLTQLANRTLLHERIEAAIRTTAPGTPEEQRVAVLLLDLDRFKAVNDTLGHHVGDRLLVHVADQLRRHVRGTDTVARLGGDEFVILLPGGTEREAQALAHRLQTAFLGGVDVDGRRLDVGASIGIAAGLLQDAETLLRQADADMYRVKEISHANS
jgi:diguanylate cyclase (GGDEF)-like protein